MRMFARIPPLKLIKPKSKTLQLLTFVDGSAFVSTFIYTARRLTIVSRANVIKRLTTKKAAIASMIFSSSGHVLSTVFHQSTRVRPKYDTKITTGPRNHQYGGGEHMS